MLVHVVTTYLVHSIIIPLTRYVRATGAANTLEGSYVRQIHGAVYDRVDCQIQQHCHFTEPKNVITNQKRRFIL